MALEKKITTDYRVVGEYKHINIIDRTMIMEGGKELSSSIHQTSLTSSDNIDSQSDELKTLASALWTDEVKAAWAAKQAD